MAPSEDSTTTAPPSPPPSPKREMKVLALGLPRTGTASVARALERLGLEKVHHGLKIIDSPSAWRSLERAADASFPVLPSYTGRPFTRADWDGIFGGYDAVTDLGSVFAPQLLAAYPAAKVVLVRRDFDRWLASVDASVLRALWGPLAWLSVDVFEPLIGSRAGPASRKIMLGLFGARTPAECRARARRAYDGHYAGIKARVPPARLLEFDLAAGWAPLCAFLDVPVPAEPFPRVNEAAEMKRIMLARIRQNFVEAAAVAAPWVVGAAAVGIGAWWMLG